MKTKETIRKSAEMEIRESFNESGLSINPGDLDDRTPTPVRISTTKEEFLLYFFEKTYLRPSFLLNQDTLELPVFFVKADKNSQDFISDVREEYRLYPNKFLMLSGFHMIKREPTAIGLIPESVILPDGSINVMVADSIDKLATLKPRKREVLYGAIESIIRHKENMHILADVSPLEIFAACVKENDKVLRMFNESHYEDTPPKCVVVDAHKSELNYCAIVRLLLMHMLAFDIVVASYKSYSSIENHFPPGSYDVHYFEGSEKEYFQSSDKKNITPFLIWGLFGAVILYVILHWGIKLF